MKQLYIRIGNSEETENVIIVGEEQSMGERDNSGYKPNKGSTFQHLVETDPYSGGKCLTYIHAAPNINLDTPLYQRDYDAHEFIKRHCKDIVTWDGEADEGYVRSREAFIVRPGMDPESVARDLYTRLEREIHHTTAVGNLFHSVMKVSKKHIEKEFGLDDLKSALNESKKLLKILKKLK